MGDKLIILKKYRGEDGMRTFTIRIPADLVDEIEAISAKTDFSRNNIIIRLISYGLKHYEVQ